MKRICVMLLALICLLPGMTLKEAYDLAGPGEGYGKVIRLEKGKLYTGGLFIGNYFNHFLSIYSDAQSPDVRIHGNGAIIDLQGGQLSIGYCRSRLDIDSCVIINGNIRYHGYSHDNIIYEPAGSVRNVTFYRTDDYCVRIELAGGGITLDHNLFVDCIGTGSDFEKITGARYAKIETGICVAGTMKTEYGIPEITSNWSYYSRGSADNINLLRHYGFL